MWWKNGRRVQNQPASSESIMLSKHEFMGHITFRQCWICHDKISMSVPLSRVFDCNHIQYVFSHHKGVFRVTTVFDDIHNQFGIKT